MVVAVWRPNRVGLFGLRLGPRYDDRVPGPLAGGDPSKSASAQARAAELVGRTISDRYKIVELVAMGAMGAVYKGEHLLMRKQVAIKVLHPEIEDFPELVARFEREAIAGAHINHPNVASASDFGKFDGDSYFLILEYIEGTTLSDIIKQGPLEPLRAARIAKQLAAALGAAHQRGIVHRDVKPRNIMICEPSILDTVARGGDDEIVKLIDFGLAKVPVEKLSTVARDPVADSRDLTNAGVVMGTVAYMAPETALGMGSVQARADLYSVGIILYEMLAGMHPFEAVEPQKLFAAHCSLPVPSFATRNPSVKVPADLESIVMRLLEKDPSARYPDADSLVAALDAFKMRVALTGTVSLKRPELPAKDKARASGDRESPAATSTSGGHYIPMLKRSQSSRTWIVAGGALAVVAVIAIVVIASRGSGDSKGSSASPATATPTTTAAVATAPVTGPPSTKSSGGVAPPASSGVAAAPGAATLEAALAKSPSEGAAAALAYVKKGGSLTDPAAVASLAKIAGALADGDMPQAEPLFTELANVADTGGADVIYEVLAANETSKGATRARMLLDRADVYAKLPAPLKLAYDLRRATCDKRAFLFARAGKEGDQRALAILTSMMPPACDPQKAPSGCCFLQHGELEKAIADLKTKTGGK